MFKIKNKDSRSGVFIVNFEHVSHLFLVFLLLTLVNTGWGKYCILHNLEKKITIMGTCQN